MTARRTVVVAVGVVLVALVATGVVLRRPAGGAPAGERRAVATTTVTRQTLVDVTTVPGKLAYGPEQAVESRLTGTVTGEPGVGTIVERGKALFRIDDKPVVLLVGALPAYRTLTAGQPPTPPPTPTPTVDATRGADVRQFEENLRALGYSGFTVDDQYNGQTATAVKRWQKDLGLAQTGDVELGRVVYAPGPVRVAKLELIPGAVASGPVLMYTGTARLVTATVPEHQQELAKVATKVTVALPSGKEVPGTVTAVDTPADDQAATGQEPTLDVVVALDDQAAVNGLDDGPAQVRFVAQERKDVLVVPVGALLALAEGGYGLQVLDGGTDRIVAVTTGLFADGKVEISGPDVHQGMTVGMAQ